MNYHVVTIFFGVMATILGVTLITVIFSYCINKYLILKADFEMFKEKVVDLETKIKDLLPK